MKQLKEESEEEIEPNTYIYLLKTKYDILVEQGSKEAIRDAEMCLLNILEVLDQHKEDFEMLAPQEVLSAEMDLLLHYLQHETKTLAISTIKQD